VTERYEIRLSTKLEEAVSKIGAGASTGGPLIVEERMSDAGFCSSEAVRALWKEKERIDSFFDEEQEACYYRARNSVFPQDQKGSDKFRNRAGDKLWEVHQVRLVASVVDQLFSSSLFFRTLRCLRQKEECFSTCVEGRAPGQK
jgi:hypothetical protein